MGRYDNILFGLSDNILETLRREDIEPGFAEVIPYLKSIRADLQLFENQGDFRIPDSRINNVDQAVNQIQNGISRIIEFKPMGMNNPQGERQSILETMKQLSDLVAENFRPYIRPDFSELETRRAQVVALQEDLAGRIVDARQTTAAADKALKDAESLVSELRSGAVAKASEEISGYYKKATSEHKTAAKRYLAAAAALGLILVALLIVVFYLNPPDVSTNNWLPVLIREALGRVLVLLVLTAAVAFCTKNYRINKHLQIMNQTRYNALETAAKYVAGVTTDEARNIVVAELVRSIFTPGDTGYMSTDREQTIIENPGSLLGIVGSAVKK